MLPLKLQKQDTVKYCIMSPHSSSTSITDTCLGQSFPLIIQKVSHSDLFMVCNITPFHNVLPHQVWWSCIKQLKRYAPDMVFLWCPMKVKK